MRTTQHRIGELEKDVQALWKTCSEMSRHVYENLTPPSKDTRYQAVTRTQVLWEGQAWEFPSDMCDAPGGWHVNVNLASEMVSVRIGDGPSTFYPLQAVGQWVAIGENRWVKCHTETKTYSGRRA